MKTAKLFLILAFGIFIISLASAGEFSDFMNNLKKNPADFSIVVSSYLSSEEIKFAEELSIVSKVKISSDDIEKNENMIIIGKSGENKKAVLGNSDFPMHISANNLFISGNEEENIGNLKNLIFYFSGGNLPIERQEGILEFSGKWEELISFNDNESESKMNGGGGIYFYIIIILLIILLVIIIILLIRQRKREKLSNKLLKDYLIKCKNQGMDKEGVYLGLIRKGWDKKLVEEEFKKARWNKNEI